MRIRVRRAGTVAVGGVALGAGSVLTLTGLAAAQASEDISVSPSSGAPGTAITVSGAGCLGDEVVLRLLDGDDTVADGGATPDEEGAWSGTLVVPDDFDEPTELAIDASCLGGDIDYSDASFLVDPPDEEPPPTSPTTTPTTTPTTSPPTTGAPGAPGAPGDGGDGGEGDDADDDSDDGDGDGDTTPTTAAPSVPDTRMTPPPTPTPVVAQPNYTG